MVRIRRSDVIIVLGIMVGKVHNCWAATAWCLDLVSSLLCCRVSICWAPSLLGFDLISSLRYCWVGI